MAAAALIDKRPPAIQTTLPFHISPESSPRPTETDQHQLAMDITRDLGARGFLTWSSYSEETRLVERYVAYLSDPGSMPLSLARSHISNLSKHCKWSDRELKFLTNYLGYIFLPDPTPMAERGPTDGVGFTVESYETIRHSLAEQMVSALARAHFLEFGSHDEKRRRVQRTYKHFQNPGSMELSVVRSHTANLRMYCGWSKEAISLVVTMLGYQFISLSDRRRLPYPGEDVGFRVEERI